MPNVKWPFTFSHQRIERGGWGRETTTRELPVSRSMAGVDMRLTAGGVRELHWHTASEWAYLLAGRARITAVDQEGRAFVDDVETGDLWFFPPGIPHSIQGLEPEGTEFLLVFDDGNFSEDSTFLLTDWLRHTPREVLVKNFGWAASVFDTVPEQELYIFEAPLPGPIEQDRRVDNSVPQSFSYKLHQQPAQEMPGGRVRIVDTRQFPVSTTTAAALVELEPGGLREMHWHPNADEWQYLDRRRGPDDDFRRRSQSADIRFPGRRCGVRSLRDGALHREYGFGAAAVFGTVPGAAVPGRIIDAVAGADATHAGGGASGRRSGAAGYVAAEEAAGDTVKDADASKELKPGDKVSWNTSQGVARGTVERKVTGTQHVKGHVAKASPDDPEYRVRSDKSGKEAVHRPEALRKA